MRLHILPLQVRPPSLSARREGVGTTSSRSHVLRGPMKVNIAGNVPITASTFHSPVQGVEFPKTLDPEHQTWSSRIYSLTLPCLVHKWSATKTQNHSSSARSANATRPYFYHMCEHVTFTISWYRMRWQCQEHRWFRKEPVRDDVLIRNQD